MNSPTSYGLIGTFSEVRESKGYVSGTNPSRSVYVGKGYILNQTLFWAVNYMELSGYNGSAIIYTATYNSDTGYLTVTCNNDKEVSRFSIYWWTSD